MAQPQRPRLVGAFIRQRRETIHLSQKALGQLLTPPVTTQFISNLERGVTPLPLAHVPALVIALKIAESDLMSLLEREYAVKLSGKLGSTETTSTHPNAAPTSIAVSANDFEFIKKLYEAYRQSDAKTRQTFASVCEGIFHIDTSSNQ